MATPSVTPRRPGALRASLLAWAAASACTSPWVSAQVASPASSTVVAAPAASAAATKDVVVDSAPAATVPAGTGALVPTPGRAASASAASRPAPAARLTTPAHDNATSGALAELALDLLRQQSTETGNAQVNAVVSPVSLASALGMVHAGTLGTGAREIAALLGASSSGERAFATRFPGMLDRLSATGAKSGAFVMANRVWMDQAVVSAVPASYAALVTQRFAADGAVVPFKQSAAARQAINGWVSKQTAKRIPELMPEGSITPTTRLVVTNAIHFKSKWAQPFDAAQTVARPFQVSAGSSKPVPTMVDERQVRMGTVDNVTVIELPFAGNEFTLMVGMPPAGHTLNAFETDLEGLDMVGWSSQLKATNCRLELPKFTIAPASKPLKGPLQALGVKTVFGAEADLSPMLGKAAKGVYLDNVYQSATIIIEEQGGEAAAATGGAMQAKSFAMPAQACAVDRPFIFAVVHKATGAPLFVGKVADPTQP